MLKSMDKNKNNSKKQLAIYVIKSLHFVLSIALFTGAWLLFRYHGKVVVADKLRYDLYVIVGYSIILSVFNKTYNSYLLDTLVSDL